jgi:hypothetical protein
VNDAAPADTGEDATANVVDVVDHTTSVTNALPTEIQALMQVMMNYTMDIALYPFSFVLCICRYIMKLHLYAAAALIQNHHTAFCFVFCYTFPGLVQIFAPWTLRWLVPCLWFAFLLEIICIQNTPSLPMLRLLFPTYFIADGFLSHNLLWDLNGGERLLVAFLLCAYRTRSYPQPPFLLFLTPNVLLSFLYGSHALMHWILGVSSLLVLHFDPAHQPEVLESVNRMWERSSVGQESQHSGITTHPVASHPTASLRRRVTPRGRLHKRR